MLPLWSPRWDFYQFNTSVYVIFIDWSMECFLVFSFYFWKNFLIRKCWNWHHFDKPVWLSFKLSRSNWFICKSQFFPGDSTNKLTHSIFQPKRISNETYHCISETDVGSKACDIHLMQEHVQNCLHPLVSLTKKCLPHRSRDLPEFIAKLFEAVVGSLGCTNIRHLLAPTAEALLGTRRRECGKSIYWYFHMPPTVEELCW